MQKVYDEADCLASQSEVEEAIDRLSKEITGKIQDSNPIIISNMSGGLIFTGMLFMRFRFPCELDYCHVTRYRGNTRGEQLSWTAKPGKNLSGRTILIVDDIIDEGHTLEAILKHCHESDCKSVYSAVLVDKIHDRKLSENIKADFVGLTIPDRYVFGYGLDYKNYWRNAPGIFAVKSL